MKHDSDFDLPAGLEGLVDLALDLRWTSRDPTDKIWERLDAETWEKTKNPDHYPRALLAAFLYEYLSN